MIAGHFGFAAGVKAREPAVPLWALMLACQWLDVVFVPLFMAHIERIENVPGSSGGYGAGIIYADYTHSLVGAALLAAIFGAVSGWRWGRRAGAVLGGVVFSHWLLDLIVHRADLPILPGNWLHLPRLGFGLWRVPLASAGLELLLVLGGALLYWRAALAVARNAGRPKTLPSIAAGAVLLSGLITLGLSLLGN